MNSKDFLYFCKIISKILVTVNYSLQFLGETFGGDTKRGL